MNTIDHAKHPHHKEHKKTHFPVAIPWLIVLVVVGYLAAAVGVGKAFLAGVDSPRILVAASWLPIPVAKVDGELIWARQYLSYRTFIKTFIERAQQNGQAIDSTTPLEEQVVQLLVSNRTIERAAKRANLSVTNKEIDAAYNDILVAQGGGGEPKDVTNEELNTILKDLYGSSQTQLRDLIQVRLLENKVRDQLLEQVNFRQILVTDEAQANDLVKKIQSGEKFEDLAKQYSQHAESKDNGGNIGFVARGQQLPAVESVIFINPVGLVAQPVKTDFGFHVIEILAKKGIVQQSFDDWLAAEKNKYHIRIYLNPKS
jgi:foldase protein PrsA